MASYKITLDRNGGSGGTSSFYTDGAYATTYNSNRFFSDSALTKEILKISPASLVMFSLQGYYTSLSGGDLLISASGSLINLFNIRITQNATAYAHWKRASWDFNLSAEGSSIPKQTVYIKVSVGGTYSDDKCKTPATSVPVPTKAGCRFLGYFGNSGTQFVNADGTLTSALLERVSTNSATVYARWEVSHTLTLDPNGGTISTPSVQVYEGQPIGTLPDPIFSPNRFLGWYTASTGGTKVKPTDTYTWTTDTTIHAHWEAPHALTFNPTGGQTSEVSRSVFTGDALGTLPTATKSGYFFDGWWTAEEGGAEITPETVYTATADTTVYAHWSLDEQWNLTFVANGGTVSTASKRVRPGNPVGNLPTPEYGGREFLGWFTQQTGGTQYTASTVFDLHQDLTLYAHWFRYEYTLRFDPYGGTTDETERTVTINEPIGELPEPTKYANTFLGWFTSRDGGEEWDEDTVFENTYDTTLYAHWEIDPLYARTISLNAEGGAVSPTTVSCTYGLPIDTLPTPSNSGMIFLGWFTAASGGTRYIAGATCDWSGTLTLHAHWSYDVFGYLTDFFNLETADGPLMLVASTDGATRSVTETSHSGALAIKTTDSSVGAFERGGILLNPTCTYRIRKSGNVQIQLGKAWAKTGTVKSGYMIVSAEYATASDVESVLVVRGAANEGADAINRWNVNISVNPDHIAQDPMGAVSGGGEMTECKTLVTCDPVVPMENGMPCASDVVHGKVVVTATTNAYLGESAPTASGSFIETNGDPNSETDVDFITYSFKAERSL